MKSMTITNVTPQNVREETLFCVKDISSPAFKCKEEWFCEQYQQGLRIAILKDNDGAMIGYIEYIPAEHAWRPIEAENYMFIHCMYIYAKKNRHLGYGSELIRQAEEEARHLKMQGVCVMSSSGSWMADKRIFLKNGYSQADKKDRFELLYKNWTENDQVPEFLDWSSEQDKYQGWHLLYADQCPWHEKSVAALLTTAMDYGIELQVTKLTSAEQARNAPSGFGVFSLLHDGRLLEDHYLSATRFKNILRKELQLSP